MNPTRLRLHLTLALLSCLSIWLNIMSRHSGTDEFDSLQNRPCLTQKITPFTHSYEDLTNMFSPCIAQFMSRSNQILKMNQVVSNVMENQKGRYNHLQNISSNIIYGVHTDVYFSIIGETRGHQWIGPKQYLPLSGNIFPTNITFNHIGHVSINYFDRHEPHTLDNFLQVLSAIKKPINILITSDKADILLNAHFDELNSNFNIKKIFTPNPNKIHPKLHPFPRGVQVPSKLHQFLTTTSLTLQDKDNLLLCSGIHVHDTRSFRKKILEDVEANGFECLGDWIKNYEEMMMRSKFVLSPRGYGRECYRTWEALTLQAIPIIEYDELNQALYEGLPIVQVKNWSSITPEYLEKTWDRMIQDAYDVRKVYSPYWMHELTS